MSNDQVLFLGVEHHYVCLFSISLSLFLNIYFYFNKIALRLSSVGEVQL